MIVGYGMYRVIRDVSRIEEAGDVVEIYHGEDCKQADALLLPLPISLVLWSEGDEQAPRPPVGATPRPPTPQDDRSRSADVPESGSDHGTG